MSTEAVQAPESPAGPHVVEIVRSEEHGSVKLLVPDNLPYFRGHFPDFAILPGVVQVDWAVRYARELFPLDGAFPARIKVKFRKPIRPGQSLTLSLKYLPPQHIVQFDYSDADGPYASGQIGFAPE